MNKKIPSYRDISLGLEAESHVVTFLSERGIQSLGASAVLKNLRTLNYAGALDDPIVRQRRLLAAGAITNPAPLYTQDILDQ